MDQKQASSEQPSILCELFLTSEKATKCLCSLSKLRRHLQQPVTLTGSIATSWQLLQKDIQREKKHLNDIDTLVEGLTSIGSSSSQVPDHNWDNARCWRRPLTNSCVNERSRGTLVIRMPSRYGFHSPASFLPPLKLVRGGKRDVCIFRRQDKRLRQVMRAALHDDGD